LAALWLLLQISLGAVAIHTAWIALRGIRASDTELAGMSKIIGVRDRRQARFVCRVTVVPLTLAGVGLVAGGMAVLGSQPLGG
jgi:hypothetical protein